MAFQNGFILDCSLDMTNLILELQWLLWLNIEYKIEMWTELKQTL